MLQSCPDDLRLTAFAAGGLPAAEQNEVRQHV